MNGLSGCRVPRLHRGGRRFRSTKATWKLKLSRIVNDDAYYRFCIANRDLRLERNARGEVIIQPPAGGESAYRSTNAVIQLGSWALKDGNGKAFGSSLESILPSGAGYSPDAAWVSEKRLAQLTKEQLRKFPPVCPNFVIEVMSPSDRLKPSKDKMRAWMGFSRSPQGCPGCALRYSSTE
jgi:Uma2 family endonuclease